MVVGDGRRFLQFFLQFLILLFFRHHVLRLLPCPRQQLPVQLPWLKQVCTFLLFLKNEYGFFLSSFRLDIILQNLFVFGKVLGQLRCLLLSLLAFFCCMHRHQRMLCKRWLFVNRDQIAVIVTMITAYEVIYIQWTGFDIFASDFNRLQMENLRFFHIRFSCRLQWLDGAFQKPHFSGNGKVTDRRYYNLF